MLLKPGKTPKADGTIDPNDLQTVANVGDLKLLNTFEDFKQNFGDFQTGNLTLAQAVFGFFNNGGTACYVGRVAKDSDLADLTIPLGKLEAHDDIALVAVPGATTQVQQEAILGHCFRLRNRFAVLDAVAFAPNASLADITLDKVVLSGQSEAGSFGAVYFPQIQVFDPVSKQTIAVPPSGHVTGVYARTDAERGVFKAPANEVVLGALGLSPQVGRPMQDRLNPANVNMLRSLDGAVKVFGARTRADDAHAQFLYVSTRRYMNFLRESIEKGTQFVVFEPNDQGLWQRIVRTLTDFLTRQWQEGALFGDSPKEAFFVRCDASLNPQAVRDVGQVITEIGVAIVRPAEFVIFRIQQGLQ